MILGISILRFDATAEIFSPKAMRFSFSSAISDANSLKGFVGSMNFCKAPLILTNVFGGTSLKTIPGLSGSITAFFISPLIDFLYDYIGSPPARGRQRVRITILIAPLISNHRQMPPTLYRLMDV